MILSLNELIARLHDFSKSGETSPSEALWITIAPEGERHIKSVDYRTPDDNTLVRVYLDGSDSIVGIEIFP